jgi:hypothetical protein
MNMMHCHYRGIARIDLGGEMTRFQRGYLFTAHSAWHVRYVVTAFVDGQTKRVQKSTRICSNSGVSKRQARTLAQQVLDRVNNEAGSVPQVDVPVTDFWQTTFLPHLERTTKASTLHGYKKLWGQHLALHLASFTLRQYKTVDATRFLTSLAERGLCTRTIAHVRSLLSGLFRHALRTGLIETNPVRNAGSLTPARTPEPTPRTRSMRLRQLSLRWSRIRRLNSFFVCALF